MSNQWIRTSPPPLGLRVQVWWSDASLRTEALTPHSSLLRSPSSVSDLIVHLEPDFLFGTHLTSVSVFWETYFLRVRFIFLLFKTFDVIMNHAV